jgi:diguanylate cyclase (GGDEF)-like protein/PAS domain S-box-containing protein
MSVRPLPFGVMELAPPGGGTPSPVARAAELAALAAGDCHGLLDANGGVLFASPSVEKVTGYRPGEYAQLDHTELMHEADRPAAAHRWAELMAHPGATQTWLVRSRHRDGQYRWLEGIFINLLDDPQWGGVVVAFTDVTEGRGLDPVVDTEGRLEALLRSSPDVIGSLSPEGTITWISNSVHQLLGFEPAEMIGRSAFDFIREEDQAETIERMAAAIDDVEEVEPITLRVDHADGSSSMVEITGAPVHDPDGRVREFTISLHDVQWRHDALEALRASEQRFRSLTESSPTGIYQRDDAGMCTYVNQRWCEIAGQSASEALGMGWRDIVHPDDLWMFEPILPLSQSRPNPKPLEFRMLRPDGAVRWVSLRTSILYDDDGLPTGAIGAIEDITERKQSQREMQRLTDIFEATADLVAIANRPGDLMYLNAAARRFLGVSAESTGLHLRDALSEGLLQRVAAEILPVVDAEGSWSGEVPLDRPEGGVMPVWAQLLRHRDPEDDHVYYSIVMHDLSERKAFEHRLAHQATHDPLTGLPNRSLLIERLDRALIRARRHQRRVAVLFLDLDHFKVVNDSLGHSLGDRLLVAISERLALALRPGDTVARFGGDEFVVLCEDVLDQADAVAVAERVDRAISGRFVVDDTEVFVGVSIGIACPVDVDVDAETLIRDADAAMYRAKDRGRARWELFDHAMRASAVDRLDIETALRRSLERRELRIYYQPIIELRTGTIDGVEALLRWEHPERGLLNPDEFITVAEETGLIVPIGAWVLDQACRQVQRWQAEVPALDPLRLSVNLSGRQLGHAKLVEDVAAVLGETGIDPNLVELEITESVLMDDVEMSQETLSQLHALGVKLAVDDFGTGYSSLSYLRRFPVDLLKVDKSFVEVLTANAGVPLPDDTAADASGPSPGGPNDRAGDIAVVAAIVTLAHSLGLVAVAEGVETAAQLALLRQLGCDRGQGYYMARPGTDHDTGELLRAAAHW